MKRIFIEADKCEGCKNCSAVCMQAHRKDLGDMYSLNLSSQENETRNFILLNDLGEYIPIFCRHCDDPDCIMSCMSGALAKDPENGYVLYNEDKCGACFMCVMACPYGVPKPDRATKSKLIKCDFCINDEEGPNCVRMCPTKAIHLEEATV